MIHNSNSFVKIVIDGNAIADKLLHNSRLVGQRPYKGKPESGIKPGATVTLQITVDSSGGYVDRSTGEICDNTMETIDVTIVDCDFPLPLKKGDYCDVSGFLPECSYYIDHNLILRYSSIRKATPSAPTREDK